MTDSPHRCSPAKRGRGARSRCRRTVRRTRPRGPRRPASPRPARSRPASGCGAPIHRAGPGDHPALASGTPLPFFPGRSRTASSVDRDAGPGDAPDLPRADRCAASCRGAGRRAACGHDALHQALTRSSPTTVARRGPRRRRGVPRARSASSPREDPVADNDAAVSPVTQLPPPEAAPAIGSCVTAHRGTGPGTRLDPGRDVLGEHASLPSLEALDCGCRRLEADYWPTADGQIVAHHDQTLDRMTGSGGPDRPAHLGRDRAAPAGERSTRFRRFEEVVAAVRGLRRRIGSRRSRTVGCSATGCCAHMVETDVDGTPVAYEPGALHLLTDEHPAPAPHASTRGCRLGLITRSDHRSAGAGAAPGVARRRAHRPPRRRLRPTSARPRSGVYAVSVRGVDTVAQLHRAVDRRCRPGCSTNRPEVLGRAC